MKEVYITHIPQVKAYFHGYGGFPGAPEFRIGYGNADFRWSVGVSLYVANAKRLRFCEIQTNGFVMLMSKLEMGGGRNRDFAAVTTLYWEY
jgi:hypothetical protein